MSKLILPVLDRSPLHPALGAWLVMTMAGIPFRERIEKADGIISRPLVHVSAPLSETPVLYHGRRAVWGALGIMEYLAELFPEKNLWPKAVWARTIARAVSHEVQAKLDGLRAATAANVRRPGLSAETLSSESCRLLMHEKARLEEIVRECRAQFGRSGRFLFGRFTVSDAVLVPALLFFDTYAVVVEPETRMYMKAVLTTDAMASWREAAMAESVNPPLRQTDAVRMTGHPKSVWPPLATGNEPDHRSKGEVP